MTSQTVPPAQWIIVNDGSTDATGELALRAAAEHSWITVVNVPTGTSTVSRGGRAMEAKEIKAFHKGLEQLKVPDWDFIVKLDADVGFAPDYFARCLAEFAQDPKLGLGGGLIQNKIGDQFIAETAPAFHVRGATKIYRRACYESIGGIPNGAGWDTIDEVTANMKGWKTRTFDDIPIAHYRYTGAANGSWKNGVKNGLWSYIAGYHPVFLLVRCARQCLHRPYLLGSAALLHGYVSGYMKGVERAGSDVVRYMQEQQMNRLLGRPTMWR
ncbi:glycosyl transferase family 2 (plasmid) [Bryobacterales bacterium F-183]|nr:glycosyl transferase family 2 [Bryobacterales bacterium F-183]